MKKLIFLCLMLIPLIVQAGTVKVEPVDRQIMHHIFNAEWQRADSLLEHQIKLHPNHPKYYFLKTPFYFYTRYFTQTFPRDSALQLVAEYAQKAIDIGEELEQTTEIKFYLGCANGYLSRAQMLLGEYWDGFWSGRDSRNYLEEVVEENPNCCDAYLGLGAAEYYADVSITGFYSFLVWLGGMSGDRQTGLDYFKKVAEKGELFRGEANFILGLLYRFYENDLVQAHSYLSKLQAQFPNNRFILNQFQQSLLAKAIEEKGVEFLEAEIDSLQSRYQVNNSFVLNGMGYSFLNQERLDDALVVFQVNLKLYPDEANPYDSLAECYMRRDENELAIKYYRMAFEKLPHDQTINEQFRERLKNSIKERLSELGAEVNT